jgi:hypothetical protein
MTFLLMRESVSPKSVAFRKGGLGVPLVAARIYYGVTALIRFVGRAPCCFLRRWFVGILVLMVNSIFVMTLYLLTPQAR